VHLNSRAKYTSTNEIRDCWQSFLTTLIANIHNDTSPLPSQLAKFFTKQKYRLKSWLTSHIPQQSIDVVEAESRSKTLE